MAMKGKKTAPRAVAINTGAVRLVQVNALREMSIIANSGTVAIYLGRDNTVTTANGLPLAAGASLTDDVSDDEWWAIAGGAGEARIIEVV